MEWWEANGHYVDLVTLFFMGVSAVCAVILAQKVMTLRLAAITKELVVMAKAIERLAEIVLQAGLQEQRLRSCEHELKRLQQQNRDDHRPSLNERR